MTAAPWAPSALCLQRQGCLQHPLDLQWVGSCAWGCGMGGSGKTHREHPLPPACCHCSSPLARSPAGSRIRAWLELEERRLRDSFPEQTGCSQGSPCGVAGVRRERSPLLAAGFPAPSPGTEPASHPVPFPPQQTVACCQALSCTIRENKYPLHSPLVFCFVLHSLSGLK